MTRPRGERSLAAEAKVRIARGLARIVDGSMTWGAAVLIEDGSNWIALVGVPYRGGGFGLPGGFVRRGETPERAAVREVYEETGLSIDLTGVQPNVLVDADYPHVHFLFRAAHERVSLRPTGGWLTRREVSNPDWFPVDSLPPLHKGVRLQLTTLGLADPLG